VQKTGKIKGNDSGELQKIRATAGIIQDTPKRQRQLEEINHNSRKRQRQLQEMIQDSREYSVNFKK
jgi:hypothetical protein